MKPADATPSLETSAKLAQAHRQTGDGTPQTAQVFATLFVYGNGERRHREEHREEVIVRRQHPGIFLQRAEPADFSWLPPERDPPALESDPASDPVRCKRVWFSSACFLSGCVPVEPLRRRLEQNTASRPKRRKTQKGFRERTNAEGAARALRRSRGRLGEACRDQFVSWQTDHGGTPLEKKYTKIQVPWEEAFSRWPALPQPGGHLQPPLLAQTTSTPLKVTM